MQYQYRQSGSLPPGQRNSVVDKDRFPPASLASSSLSNRNHSNDNMNDAFTITRNNNNSVRTMQSTSTTIKLGDWGTASTAASSSTPSSSQNHDRIAAALAVATNRQPAQPMRDQQIFRRQGAAPSMSRSFDSSNSSNRGRNNNGISRSGSASPSKSNGVNTGGTSQLKQHGHLQYNTPPRKSTIHQLPSSSSQGNLSNIRAPQHSIASGHTRQTSPSKVQPLVTTSKTSPPSKSASSSSSQSHQQSSSTNTPATLLRNRSGMVNKLKAGIEKKLSSMQQQNNQSPLEIAKLKLKQTMGVQFNVPPSKQYQSKQNTQAKSHAHRVAATTSDDIDEFAPSYYPTTLSPSRSNVQSDVTGYSAGSSSYGTGWPGTVDKRGRAYAREPSYSESEDGTNSQQREKEKSKSQNNDFYPSQQYRPPSQTMFNNALVNRKPSFDGGDSVAELEAWMAGGADGDSVAFTIDHSDVGKVEERSSGPIDLDQEYERRFDSKRKVFEQRERTLDGISETKTAADVYLEAALGMSNDSSTSQKMNAVQSRSNDDIIRQTSSASPLKTPSPTKSMNRKEARRLGIDTSGSEKRILASGKRIITDDSTHDEEEDFDNTNNYNSYVPSHYQGPQPMTEEALRNLDSQIAPPRGGASMNFRGFTGFLDKTKDVPNLMDDESLASTSLETAAYSVDGNRNTGMGLVLPSITEKSQNVPRSSLNFDSGSDVFDGLQNSIHRDGFFTQQQKVHDDDFSPVHQSFNDFPDDQFEQFATDFNPFAVHRDSVTTSREYVDPSMDISSLDVNGSESDYENVPDLSIYYVDPDLVRKMVRAFRKICTSQMEINSSNDMLSEFESLVDTKKAFALFEMRSRIMETDIDRGLERRGGTNVVDDIVLTQYHQAAHRVRDAVIVSKAWRDGATPKDVITAHLLTRRSAKAYSIPRLIERIRRPDNPFYKQYWLEEVRWLDDTDFMMMRCQSLDAGTMKGFEMFTIGDCQSILLKLTSDNATVSTWYEIVFI